MELMIKHLIRPDRVRQVPQGFNWVDHRLVRHGYLDRCNCTDLALYLFLVTVSDAEGLSYYSDPALCRRLKLTAAELAAARTHLQQADLIAYRKPLYQVLSLESSSDPTSPTTPPGASRAAQTQSVADILRRALQGGAQ
jgi:hypothetical protein